MEWKTTQESCKENSTRRLSQKHLCEQEQEQEAFVQEIQRSRKIVEVLFYTVMILWGLYLVVTEDIEDVKKDFPWAN